MSKKDKVVYKEKVNWKKEAALLPGYAQHGGLQRWQSTQILSYGVCSYLQCGFFKQGRGSLIRFSSFYAVHADSLVSSYKQSSEDKVNYFENKLGFIVGNPKRMLSFVATNKRQFVLLFIFEFLFSVMIIYSSRNRSSLTSLVLLLIYF